MRHERAFSDRGSSALLMKVSDPACVLSPICTWKEAAGSDCR